MREVVELAGMRHRLSLAACDAARRLRPANQIGLCVSIRLSYFDFRLSYFDSRLSTLDSGLSTLDSRPAARFWPALASIWFAFSGALGFANAAAAAA